MGKYKITTQQLEAMTEKELEAFLYQRLFDLFRIAPRLKEDHRREMLEVIDKLANHKSTVKPEEREEWEQITDIFKKRFVWSAAQAARETALQEDSQTTTL